MTVPQRAMNRETGESARAPHAAVCPFCSLLCDDLIVEQAGGRVRVLKNGCDRAVSGFESPAGPNQPRLKGKPATIEQCIERAAAILRGARFPLFSGLGTDVGGMRAVLSLAERTGGALDHMHGNALQRNIGVLQGAGWMTTTLTELKNRADLIVFAGADAVSTHPRFFERLVWNQASLFQLDSNARQIVYLGAGLNTKPGTSPEGRKPLHVRFDPRRLIEIVSALRALAAGHRLQAPSIAGVRIPVLNSIVEKMKAARYGVLAWSSADLDYPHAELAVEACAELVKDLNDTTRFSGLPLGGNDGAITANSVCAWQTGFPLRTAFAAGYPAHDAHRYSAGHLVESGSADALVWISAFRAAPPPAAKPLVVLGAPNTHCPEEPEVFIPVAIPGLDHAAQLVRCDSVVSLYLERQRTSPLPSVAHLLAEIQNAL
ncbi:MAG: formylmethanofuran dehydrogenase subunit B [Gammaproteobacteria bacterium]